MKVTVTQRLARTAAGDRLVPDTDPEAASLFATPGKEIPAEEAERWGLVNGALPADGEAGQEPAPQAGDEDSAQAGDEGKSEGEGDVPDTDQKASQPAEDKAVRKPEDKGRSGTQKRSGAKS